MKTILIIDDELSICKMLRIALEAEEWNVHEAHSGEEGILAFAKYQPQIALLDLGLPDTNGINVLRRLREWTETPIIVLTVRDAPEEKIEALDLGAQDYLTKPFHTGELMARIRAVTKRETPESEATYENQGLHINFATHTVHINGEYFPLTPIEYALLHCLTKHAGKIVTKTQLIKNTWSDSPNSYDEHLRVHMASLRKKLRAKGCTNFIHTENGVGYRV